MKHFNFFAKVLKIVFQPSIRNSLFFPVIKRNYFRLENLFFSDERKKSFWESIRNFFFNRKKLGFFLCKHKFVLSRISENWFFQAGANIIFRSKKSRFFLNKYKKFFLWVEKKFWVEISLFNCTRSLQYSLLERINDPKFLEILRGFHRQN